MRFRFIMSETWIGLKRNLSMILSVTLVTFISFIFIGASALMQIQIQRVQAQWFDKVEVVVFLCPDGPSQAATCATGKAPSQAQTADIEETIQNQLSDAVANITYVSKNDYYNNVFLKQYPGGVVQGRTLTADDMQASLRLKLKDATKYQAISEVLTGKQGVEKVVDQRQIFEPVFNILNRATAVTATLAAIMVLVAILLTGTTIRMSAASRKNEIEIMRLVGASNSTIRMPFILEGVIASLIGSILACGALMAAVKVFITGWLSNVVNWISLVDVGTVWAISPFLVGGAILISVIASLVSLNRYLKV